jgi:hypothetical protein
MSRHRPRVPAAQLIDEVEVVRPTARLPPASKAEPIAAPSEVARSPVVDAPAQAPVTSAEVAAQLDHKFAADGPPDGHMVEVQNKFTSLFSKRLVSGAQLGNVECRASVCRATVGFDSSDDDGAFFRHAVMDRDTRLDDGLSVIVPLRSRDADGRVSATIYMYKPDPPRPDPEQGG